MIMGLVVAALILAGLALLIVEVVFIPGTTVVGLLGVVFMVVGVIFSYSHFGSEVGFYILLSTLGTVAVALYWSFRKGAWKKFSLNSSIDSKFNEGLATELTRGTEGVTVSVLRPIGTAEFNGKIMEVKTNGDYVAAGTKVRIVHVQLNDIIVEPVN
jgi:membrane-bound ClpP family serine protease